MRNRWFAPLCILGMLAFGFIVYGRLPDRVPSHWNLQGEVDGTMRPLAAVLLPPALAALVALMPLILPHMDPRRAAYAAFPGTLRLIANTTVLFLAGLHVAMLGNALGWDVSVSRLAPIGVGLLLAVIGNELGQVQPNWFVGIRTPWTLSDPEVWRRTHRVGGRVLLASGLVIAVAAALLPVEVAGVVVLVGTLGPALLLTLYSYLLWRRYHAGGAAT